jgi:hypothetical protein
MSETVKSTVEGKNGGTLMAPWEKGVCPNPGGLPKGTKVIKKRVRNALIRYLKAHPEDIKEMVAALMAEAKTRPRTMRSEDGGSYSEGQAFAQCQKLVWERLDGLLTAQTELNVNVTYTKRIVDEEDDDHDSP